MNKELYSHFIYVNNLFKTSELKISTNNYLEINEISATGSVNHKIDLTDSDIEIKTAKPKTYYNILVQIFLLASLFTSLFQIALNNEPGFLLPLIGSALVLMSCSLIYFNFNTSKKYSIYKLSSNNIIYQIPLNSELSSEDEISDFIDELVSIISKVDYLDPIQSISLNQSSIEDQYNSLIYNLESLYNSGVIDDITFDRIDSNINEKIYPNNYEKEKHIAEVIYLHNF